MPGAAMNGIINVYKPKGMTSHDVVYRVRRVTGIKKVGHTGTLDPDAEGVLPICVGKATKAADLLTFSDKRYTARMTLGVTTDTQDLSGRVLE
ncbi:MAG: tRNA pseudouridine(55) synthase TruB, partial [Clostridiales bacterium]|nr:tRNA pseudouridine(55) synthase TruB [Clostridiales bacterium]